jgi:hypothetical protein
MGRRRSVAGLAVAGFTALLLAGCGAPDSEDTVRMGRRRRVAILTVAGLTATLLAGCGAPDGAAQLPDRAPDVSGAVGVGQTGSEPVLVDASDPYYEGMALLRGGPIVVRGGTAVSSDELREGTGVDVWTADACAESYPVQCGIEAIRIRD